MPRSSPAAYVRFALAVIATAIAAALVFGGTRIATAIGVLGAVIAALNAVIPGKKFMTDRVSRSLRQSTFLNAMTALFVIAAFVLFGYTLTLRGLKTTIVVQGIVTTAADTPAAGALIESSDGATTQADATGKFSFQVRRWRTERSKPLTLSVRRGAASQQAIVLLTADSVHVHIRLPSEHAAFRVVYTRLAKRSVDLFLDPPRRVAWDDDLRGRVFTANNPVYQELTRLARAFAQPTSHTEFDIRGRDLDVAFAERLGEDPPNRPAFAGSSGLSEANGSRHFLQMRATDADLGSLGDPAMSWFPYWVESADPRLETKLLFERPAGRADLARMDNQLARFWTHVTRDGVPPDFGRVTLYMENDPCAEEGWLSYLRIHAPLLVVDVAILENTAPYPLSFGTFRVRSSETSSLRTRAEDDTRLARAAKHEENLFSIGVLQPHEKIAVPLRMLLLFDDEDQRIFEKPRTPAPDLAATVPILNFNGRLIGADAIAQRIATQTWPTATDRTWVYGPSYAIDAVEIAGIRYEVRQQPARLTLVQSANPVGSCPFFYGYSPQHGRWLRGGTILYGRRAPKHAGTDERPLPAFDGRVRIAEEEPETSFIDHAYVVAVATDGARTILNAREERLRAADGSFVKLEQGEEIVVRFDDAPPGTQSFLFGATGYYVPRLHKH